MPPFQETKEVGVELNQDEILVDFFKGKTFFFGNFHP